MHSGTRIRQEGFRNWVTRNVEQTLALGRRLADELLPDGSLLLVGDLGVGKTVLAQGVAAGLGFDPREVQSPTFTLIREHSNGENRMVHVDLYRLDPGEVESVGLEEILYSDAVKVVEWAERIPFPVPNALKLEMVMEEKGSARRIREIQGEDSETYND